MEELLLSFLLYCYTTPEKCMLRQDAPTELTWYICDETGSNIPADMVFHVDGIVVTAKRKCTGA